MRFYHARLLFSNDLAENIVNNSWKYFFLFIFMMLFFVAFMLQMAVYGIYATECGHTAAGPEDQASRPTGGLRVPGAAGLT
jgi:hypothetical protein